MPPKKCKDKRAALKKMKNNNFQRSSREWNRDVHDVVACCCCFRFVAMDCWHWTWCLVVFGFGADRLGAIGIVRISSVSWSMSCCSCHCPMHFASSVSSPHHLHPPPFSSSSLPSFFRGTMTGMSPFLFPSFFPPHSHLSNLWYLRDNLTPIFIKNQFWFLKFHHPPNTTS